MLGFQVCGAFECILSFGCLKLQLKSNAVIIIINLIIVVMCYNTNLSRN